MSAAGPKAAVVGDSPDPADKSRQKSCNACVRSKRRCDKRTPRCTRCAVKNFSCVYQNLPPSSSAGDGGCSLSAETAAAQDPLQAMDLEDGAGCTTNTTKTTNNSNNNAGLPPVPHPFDFNTLDSSTSSNSPSGATPTATFVNGILVMNEPTDASSSGASMGLGLDPNMGFDFNSVMDFLNAHPVQGSEMQLWETPQVPKAPKTLTPEVPYMGSVCSGVEREDMLGGFQPWSIHEPDSRIGYMVNYMKDLHLTFARTHSTPFIHRHLYRGTHSSPRPLLTAYTAISAYAGRTDSNKSWAIRAICEGAAEVLKSAKDDAASSAAMTGHEKLARTQALWLLQTIRCLDGDVALRAQAERDMGVLGRWLKELEALRDNLDDVHLLDDLALRRRPPRSWEVWVFNECVRRTVLMGHVFMSLFEVLKSAGDVGFARLTDVEPDVAKWLAPHRWTFSNWLWDAQSPPAFFSAWREKPFFVVNSFFVQEVAKVARPIDVDEFARVFLTLNFGVEETKHFMLEV